MKIGQLIKNGQLNKAQIINDIRFLGHNNGEVASL